MFMDPASAFTTHDVLDANEEVVQFDTGNGSLIWVASGQRFQGYPVVNNFIGSDRGFEVRFGTKDGQRRGYFTETSSATICDINVSNGQISITGTDAKVPGS